MSSISGVKNLKTLHLLKEANARKLIPSTLLGILCVIHLIHY